MRKLIIIFVLSLLNVHVKSQNIYTALQLNVEREYKTKRPKKIVETNTFCTSSGKKVNKIIKTFDDSGMLLIEDRYDSNGSLEARLTYTNDTVHRVILARAFERWTQFSSFKETAFYSYDTRLFLIGTIDKDATGKIIQQSNIVCNDKGHPIELSLIDGNAKSFGKETATYFYDKNQVVTNVISNGGKILSCDTIKISFTEASKFPSDNEVYNEKGDVIRWTSRNLNGSQTIFEEEYLYDSFGNCTEKKIYKVTVNDNGKRKREKDRIFKKNYSY